VSVYGGHHDGEEARIQAIEMGEVTPSIGEDDLHAYVDGQLPAERRDAVQAYLRENPDAARRVTDYQAQRQAIRAAFAAAPVEPLPRELSLARIIAQRGRRPRAPWLLAASVVLALGVGMGGGWLLRGGLPQGPAARATTILRQQALASHGVYAIDIRHPIEVPGSETPHLQQWLSNRLERVVVAPDLTTLGYQLIGGRLLATERGRAAALLMYDDANHQRISILLRPMGKTADAPRDVFEKDGVNGCAWVVNGLGVAVVAAVPKSDISRLVKQIDSDLRVPG
jgi:anti-sigma factor RsiW